ncbi:hypothetical protein CPI04_07995, partial [Moraxella catarrhalis]|nr:hypothetical protein [Moraxella catarrhalis]
MTPATFALSTGKESAQRPTAPPAVKTKPRTSAASKQLLPAPTGLMTPSQLAAQRGSSQLQHMNVDVKPNIGMKRGLGNGGVKEEE